MSVYSVTILTDATSSYIVDADSPAEAAEKAGQLHWEASPSLCHQCSNEIELGDAVGAIVCFDGKEVLDTTWAGESVAKLAAGSAALHAEVEALRAENGQLRDGTKRIDAYWQSELRDCRNERDALAAELAIARRVIGRIGQLCTTPHESKERFIRRVQSVIEWQTAAQQDQPR